MDQPINQLRLRWLLTAIIYSAATSVGYLLFQTRFADNVIQWMSGALLMLIGHLGILWWGLPRNHRSTETDLLPTLGFGNAITLTRGLATGILAGFLFAPWPMGVTGWIPALLYTSAIILDYVDGYVARITNHATSLGEMLDMEFDGLAILVAIALSIKYGQIPPWYLLLGFGRPLFILGLWIRQHRGLPNYEMTESNNRRLIAGFQMGFLSIMLWPIFEPPLTTLACILFSVPLAASFLRDWLVVSGQIDPTAANYQRWHPLAKTLLESWLPLALRLMGFGAIVILYDRYGFSMPTMWIDQLWVDQLKESAPRAMTTLFSIVTWIAPFAALTFLLGILGRTSSLLLICIAAFNIVATGLGIVEGVLLFSTIWVLQFGAGLGALWSIEEKILGQRAGLT